MILHGHRIAFFGVSLRTKKLHAFGVCQSGDYERRASVERWLAWLGKIMNKLEFLIIAEMRNVRFAVLLIRIVERANFLEIVNIE